MTDTYFNIYYPGVLEEIIKSLQTEKVIKTFEHKIKCPETFSMAVVLQIQCELNKNGS